MTQPADPPAAPPPASPSASPTAPDALPTAPTALPTAASPTAPDEAPTVRPAPLRFEAGAPTGPLVSPAIAAYQPAAAPDPDYVAPVTSVPVSAAPPPDAPPPPPVPYTAYPPVSGPVLPPPTPPPYAVGPTRVYPSPKTRATVGLLQLLGGVLGIGGVGRLYAGQSVLGATQVGLSLIGWTMFWLGTQLFYPFIIFVGLWLWFVIDGVVILAGNPVDGQGRPLR